MVCVPCNLNSLLRLRNTVVRRRTPGKYMPTKKRMTKSVSLSISGGGGGGGWPGCRTSMNTDDWYSRGWREVNTKKAVGSKTRATPVQKRNRRDVCFMRAALPSNEN